MPRKRSVSDEVILDAALGLAETRGPAALTFSSLSAEVGLAPATLVQRFGSKRALMLAFAEHAASLARQPFEQARTQVAEPLGALRTALLIASRSTKGRQALTHSLAFLLEDLADEELRAHAARHARWTEASIRELLDCAVERGELAAHDTARLARALQAAWNGAMIQWAIRGRGSLATWIAAVVDTLLEPLVLGAPRAAS